MAVGLKQTLSRSRPSNHTGSGLSFAIFGDFCRTYKFSSMAFARQFSVEVSEVDGRECFCIYLANHEDKKWTDGRHSLSIRNHFSRIAEMWGSKLLLLVQPCHVMQCGEKLGISIPDVLPSEVNMHHSRPASTFCSPHSSLFPTPKVDLPPHYVSPFKSSALHGTLAPHLTHKINRPFSFYSTTFAAMSDVSCDRGAFLVMDLISLTDFDSRSSGIQPLANRIIPRRCLPSH